MQEEWRVIDAFPKYRVSNLGDIESIKSGMKLRLSRNQQGHLKVNLMKNGEVYTRLVSHIVARAFVPIIKRREDFMSVIHLDGDKGNCEALNLMWRPRYFTILYHRQFNTPNFRSENFPLVELKTNETYSSIQEAVVRNGLLFTDVLISVHERTYVWPTFQEFRHAPD